MLSEEQDRRLRQATEDVAKASRMYGVGSDGTLEATEELRHLVSGWLDPLRPRDPKVELPAHEQAVRFYAGGEGGERHGTFSGQATGFYERGRGLWKLEDIESWRPAEPQWRPKE